MTNAATISTPEAIPAAEDNPRKRAWQTRKRNAASQVTEDATAAQAPPKKTPRERAKTAKTKPAPSLVEQYAQRLERRLGVAAALVELSAEEQREVLAVVGVGVTGTAQASRRS